jgi:hypothetical protein
MTQSSLPPRHGGYKPKPLNGKKLVERVVTTNGVKTRVVEPPRGAGGGSRGRSHPPRAEGKAAS